MSNMHVRQLDRGMDLGPAHKNIAINHLVARSMGRVMHENNDVPFSPGGPEDDSPTTWHRAKKEAQAITKPEPQAYIMETDIVLCEWCYEDMQFDRTTDHDPNAWLYLVRPWSTLNHQCEHCATRTGDQSDMEAIQAPPLSNQEMALLNPTKSTVSR